MAKRILITGASRGIGLEMTRQYSRTGNSVLGLVRKSPPPMDRVEWLEGDVTNKASLHSAARVASSGLDLLVCNAGVFLDRNHGLGDDYADTWADSFAVNVEGVFNTVQALLPALQAGNGKIAIISSQMGSSERAGGGSYVYRASKAAAVNLARNLAVDLKPQNIAVGVYHPGWVQTDMGTAAAAITATESVTGLTQRFEALNIATTGGFENYDGTPMPF